MGAIKGSSSSGYGDGDGDSTGSEARTNSSTLESEPPRHTSSMGDGSEEENKNAAACHFTAYGRPLSIIESLHSRSSDDHGHPHDGTMASADLKFEPEALEMQQSHDTEIDDASGVKHESPQPLLQEVHSSMPENLEGQIYTLFERKETGTRTGAKREDDADVFRSIRIRDLPGLFKKYQQKTGTTLIDDDLRVQLNSFAEHNAEVDVQPQQLIQLINQLHEARNDTSGEARRDGDEEGEEVHAAHPSQSSYSSGDSSFSSSDSDGDAHSNEAQDAVNTPASQDKFGSSSSPVQKHSARMAFPRSQSERADLSATVGEVNVSMYELEARKQTTSDPSTPLPKHRRASAPNDGQPRDASQKRRRRRESHNEEREVLKGKGKVKAPPSAWSRPKPPALLNRIRARKDSETSALSGHDYDSGRDSDVSSIPGSPLSPVLRASNVTSVDGNFHPRQRLSSQPNMETEATTRPNPPDESSMSPSGKFVFPRAQSLTHEHMSPDANANRSLGAGLVASPSLDETSYYTRNIISPTYGDYPRAQSVSSRHSSGAGWRRAPTSTDVGSMEDTLSDEEQIAAFKAQVESLQRTVNEKSRNIEAQQRESDDYISRLQEDLDKARANLSLRRKEDALNKIRENNHLDTIASLEADLNESNSALEGLRSQHTRLQSTHDDLSELLERQMARNAELDHSYSKAKMEEEERDQHERQFDADRESYRQVIKGLHEDVVRLKEKLMGRDDDGRMISSQQATMDLMAVELEELRSGVRGGAEHRSGRATEDEATMSKRLGAELARSLGIEQLQADVGEAEQSATDEGDCSADSVIVYRHRRSRRTPLPGAQSRIVETIERSSQTRCDPIAEQSRSATLIAPPTYSEAELEKRLVERLHPATVLDAIDGQQAEMNEEYASITRRTGARCLFFEERLGKHAEMVREAPFSMGEVMQLDGFPGWFGRLKSVYEKVVAQLPKSLLEGQANGLLARKNWRHEGPSFIVVHSMPCILLIGLTIAIVCQMGRSPSHSLYKEDPQTWKLSNTLQVPWTSGPDRYDAAHRYAAPATTRNEVGFNPRYPAPHFVDRARVPT